MTMMTPRRRMIRHLSQRRLTDADTFIAYSLSHIARQTRISRKPTKWEIRRAGPDPG
jgi:hypothetical protein